MAQGNSFTFAAGNQVNDAVLNPEDRLLPPPTPKLDDLGAVLGDDPEARLLVPQIG